MSRHPWASAWACPLPLLSDMSAHPQAHGMKRPITCKETRAHAHTHTHAHTCTHTGTHTHTHTHAHTHTHTRTHTHTHTCTHTGTHTHARTHAHPVPHRFSDCQLELATKSLVLSRKTKDALSVARLLAEKAHLEVRCGESCALVFPPLAPQGGHASCSRMPQAPSLLAMTGHALCKVCFS